MRRKLFLLPVLLVGAAVPPLLRSQEPGKVPPAPPSKEAIRKLIQDLEAPEYPTRERATRELLRLEGHALEPLKRAVASARGLEFTTRARRVLDRIAIFEPGGEVVNGLKLCLTADRDGVRSGQTLWLTTTVANLTHQDLNVKVGYTTCGNYFECGAAVRRVVADGKEEEPGWWTFHCGTGAGPIFQTVRARAVVTFKTSAALLPVPRTGRPYLSFGKNGPTTLGMSHPAVAGPSAGQDGLAYGPHALRMVLSVTPEMNKDSGHTLAGKSAGVRPSNESAPYWSGTVKSNEVRLKVLP